MNTCVANVVYAQGWIGCKTGLSETVATDLGPRYSVTRLRRFAKRLALFCVLTKAADARVLYIFLCERVIGNQVEGCRAAFLLSIWCVSTGQNHVRPGKITGKFRFDYPEIPRFRDFYVRQY